jgi:hypothetical protein
MIAASAACLAFVRIEGPRLLLSVILCCTCIVAYAFHTQVLSRLVFDASTVQRGKERCIWKGMEGVGPSAVEGLGSPGHHHVLRTLSTAKAWPSYSRHGLTSINVLQSDADAVLVTMSCHDQPLTDEHQYPERLAKRRSSQGDIEALLRNIARHCSYADAISPTSLGNQVDVNIRVKTCRTEPARMLTGAEMHTHLYHT